MNRVLTTALVTLAIGAMLMAAQPPQGTVIELPAQDRKDFEKYFGRGVVGKAIEARPIDDPEAFLGFGSEGAETVRVTHGKKKGRTYEVRASRVDRPGGPPLWRIETDQDVRFGEVDENGDVVLYTYHNLKQGVMTRYSPGEPVLLKGIRPGESRDFEVEVEIFDLARPDHRKHRGRFKIVYSYVGAYEVNVPAGTFDAALFSWSYDGKVGPATIKDTQYWFVAEGVGAVARVHRKNISAMLVYSDKDKIAEVLIARE